MCFPRPVTINPEECPHDYLRIYDGRDESSPVIATICGRYVSNSLRTRLFGASNSSGRRPMPMTSPALGANTEKSAPLIV